MVFVAGRDITVAMSPQMDSHSCPHEFVGENVFDCDGGVGNGIDLSAIFLESVFIILNSLLLSSFLHAPTALAFHVNISILEYWLA